MCFSPGKGGKNRRRGKNENESEKRELVFKEDGQGDLKSFPPYVHFSFITYITFLFVSFTFKEYAQVTKMLGNGRLEAMCFDGNKRLCHIRGKLRKKVCCKTLNLSVYFFMLLLYALWISVVVVDVLFFLYIH